MMLEKKLEVFIERGTDYLFKIPKNIYELVDKVLVLIPFIVFAVLAYQGLTR